MILNTNDRSVGHRPHRGRIKRGGVFPSPEGRLYGFLTTKRDKFHCLICVKLFLSRSVCRKPYNQPSADGNTPPLVPSAPPFPRREHCPTDLSSVFKYRLFIESIDVKGISKVESLSLYMYYRL